MPSIIEGYNYDIFLSYRQKDNKNDGWVTEFVENLKGELESTFKEEISIYFDINPHDGLLETHDVDESLKEKLKCLIFIPIVSRTYCDPKSFAWEHEFKAFVEKATKDEFGLTVKLPDGNVASRILPVIIHDIDKQDINLYKSVTGLHPRGIEFIYKSPGVNRPMRLKEDNPGDNLNRTYYRDQINKVANAIKEIITGLTRESPESADFPEEIASKTKITVQQEKSIIVLPFENISPDPDQDYFSDGLTEEIITDLSYIHDLFVISRNSAMTFKGTKKKTREIASEMNVQYVLEGSVRKAGNKIRIIAQLIDAARDIHLWAEKYTGTLDDVFDIQEKVSRSISEALKIKLLNERKHTPDPEAYNLYLLGRFYWNRRTREGIQKAIECFEKAIKADKDYALAYAGLADAYHVAADWNYLNPEAAIIKAKEYVHLALSQDKNIAEAYSSMGGLLFIYDSDQEKSESYFKTALSLNPNYATGYQWFALNYTVSGHFDKAIFYMDQALRLDPLSPIIKLASGLVYYYSKSYEEAIEKFNEALILDPEFPLSRFYIFLSYFLMDNIPEATDVFQKQIDKASGSANLQEIFAKTGKNGLLDFLIELELNNSETPTKNLAILYALKGDKLKALDYIEYNVENLVSEFKYLKVEPTFVSLHSEPRFIVLLKRLGLN